MLLRAAKALIRLYQLTLSPFLHTLAGPGMGCRFEPTCSAYAHQSVQTHGTWRGAGLAAWRVLRCNPFSRGGFDPVPQNSYRSRPSGE